MAYRKPIICSDLPVLREILSDRTTALLVAPNDLDAWVDAIKELDLNENLSIQLSENAWRLANKKFSYKQRARSIMSLYNDEN